MLTHAVKAKTKDSWMLRTIRRLDELPPAAVLGACAFLILGIGLIDILTGPEIALSVLYILPVAIISWSGSRTIGVVAAFLAGITWFVADQLAQHQYSQEWIGYWNAGVRTLIFLIVTFILFELRRALRHEHDVARTDQLTGIPNARSFYEAADREIARARRRPRPISVLYIDCDDFKRVNDELGHWAGDRLLRTIAVTLDRTIRRTDLVARLGGDEFGILLPETDSEGIKVACDKVCAQLREVIGTGEWSATFSIGGVTFDQAPGSVDELLREADTRMYDVKRSGKNATRLETVAIAASSK